MLEAAIPSQHLMNVSQVHTPQLISSGLHDVVQHCVEFCDRPFMFLLLVLMR